MASVKIRKIDIISGVTECQIYSLCDYYHEHYPIGNTFTPDISIGSAVDFLRFDLPTSTDQYHNPSILLIS